MATKQQVIDRTRLELSDLKQPFFERIRTTGDIRRYELQVEKVDEFVLYERGNPEAPLTEGTDYTLEPRAGALSFAGEPPTEGTEYVAEGVRSNLFDDAEIEMFVDTAFELHTNNRGPAINYSGLPAAEVYLVALLAKIEALWVLITSASYDINIHAPEGMFIPRQQRYQQLQELRAATEEQYREISNALGVGLYRIEMYTLRRVSRMTNRYIPIYLDREIDDTRPPQRVFPGIDRQGAAQPDATVTKHDLQVYQGRPFSETFELDEEGAPLDFANYPEVTATLTRTPYSVYGFRNVLPEFTVDVDAENSSVTVSMSAEDTKKLESTGSYVWTLTWQFGDDPVPLMQGDVLVETGYPAKSVNITVT